MMILKHFPTIRSDGEQRVGVREWINHPNYHYPDNDFAILKLRR